MSKFYIGTESYYGKDALIENKNVLKDIGKKALIVTGKNSGYISGAINDLIFIFKEFGIEYSIYDKVVNNPTLENVKAGGTLAASERVDFIVGIGGGSPLDAAKAIAVLATNNIDPIFLFKNIYENKILPIVAIPTTAGTGSEVTPYSILIRDDLSTKMSFGNRDIFPKYAFLDAKYTLSLSKEITINTAIDALSHSIEGYLSKRSTPISDILAIEAFSIFGNILERLLLYNIDYEIREKLLYMSMLGGMVISHTGTTIVHGMGYSLTYFKDIPHGKANGLFLSEYLRFNYDEAKEKIDNILNKTNLVSLDDLSKALNFMMKNDIVFTDEELKKYSKLTMNQRSTKQNIKDVNENDLYEIMLKSLIL